MPIVFFSFGILMAILISKVEKIHNLKHLESNLDSETKAYLLVWRGLNNRVKKKLSSHDH